MEKRNIDKRKTKKRKTFQFHQNINIKSYKVVILKYAELLEPGIYNTKFRNSYAAARVVTGGRLDKVAWTESHNYHKSLIK